MRGGRHRLLWPDQHQIRCWRQTGRPEAEWPDSEFAPARSSSSLCFDPSNGRTNFHELDPGQQNNGKGAWAPFLGKDLQIARQEFQTAANRASEHVPKKVIDFFDSNMLPIFEFELFLPDHAIPRDREALSLRCRRPGAEKKSVTALARRSFKQTF
jgi:hypothetical protein